MAAEPQIDMAALADWKDAIVERLNKGEALLKGAGAELVKRATFTGPKKCAVETTEGLLDMRLKMSLSQPAQVISTYHLCHATRSLYYLRQAL